MAVELREARLFLLFAAVSVLHQTDRRPGGDDERDDERCVPSISIQAVKSRLHRARLDVRAQLEPFFPSAERSAGTPSAVACPDVVALFSR